MVIIKAISRSAAGHVAQNAGDLAPVSRNPDPSLHPFATEREYTRALTASKLDRMFSQPFVGSIECGDGVYSLARDMERIDIAASGGARGELAVHDLAHQHPIMSIERAHKTSVTGLSFTHTSKSSAGQNRLLSCSLDATVKLWEAASTELNDQGTSQNQASSALFTYTAHGAINGIDHHREKPMFAAVSDSVQIWDESRTQPVQDMRWHNAADTIHNVRFNQSEVSVLATAAGDRTVAIWDLRSGTSTGRFTLAMRTNALSFNPMMPTVLLCASEDHQLYTFDLRRLDRATQVYKDHVAAVMSCDWSPTGQEFVSGSYDRTVRIWQTNRGRSKDVYHTKRMQRVFTSVFSADARFVLSGSDDGNLRIWKSRASAKVGVVSGRERAALEYRDKLRERWGGVAAIRNIEKQRLLPKSIRKAKDRTTEMLEARRVKEERFRAHTKAGLEKPQSEKTKSLVNVQK